MKCLFVAVGLNAPFLSCYHTGITCHRYPLKLYFQIPCVFPVRPQIFPVPIYIICEYYIHRTDLAGLSSSWGKKKIFFQQISQYPLRLESEHLQLELTNFLVFSLCLDKIPCVLTKFPIFPVFPVPWVPCIGPQSDGEYGVVRVKRQWWDETRDDRSVGDLTYEAGRAANTCYGRT